MCELIKDWNPLRIQYILLRAEPLVPFQSLQKSALIVLHVSELGIFFLGFFQCFPVPVPCHYFSCALYISTKPHTRCFCPVFSRLQRALCPSPQALLPCTIPSIGPSSAVYQPPTSPTQCFSLVRPLPDVVLSAHIFCSLFTLCWYQKQRDLGSGDIPILCSPARRFGERVGRKSSSAPVEPGWRLLCAYGVLRELC